MIIANGTIKLLNILVSFFFSSSNDSVWNRYVKEKNWNSISINFEIVRLLNSKSTNILATYVYDGNLDWNRKSILMEFEKKALAPTISLFQFLIQFNECFVGLASDLKCWIFGLLWMERVEGDIWNGSSYKSWNLSS